MSETVHYKGKIKKVEVPNGLDLNGYAKQLCERSGIKESEYWQKYGNGNYVGLLCDEGEYLFVKNELYEVMSKNSHDLDEEIADITPNDDGTYDYEVRYYNGGAGFDEMIWECFNRIK